MRSSPSRRRKSTGLPPRRRREFRCGPSGWNRRTEARLCSTFLGTVERTEPRPCCALLIVAAPNFKTSECGCEMRLFVLRSGNEQCGSGLPVFAPMASPGSRKFASFRCESPQINSSLARSLLRGHCDARRHGAVLLPGLLSQSKSGPLLQNARLGAWESRPLA
jgi:hypothetical protein